MPSMETLENWLVSTQTNLVQSNGIRLFRFAWHCIHAIRILDVAIECVTFQFEIYVCDDHFNFMTCVYCSCVSFYSSYQQTMLHINPFNPIFSNFSCNLMVLNGTDAVRRILTHPEI